MCATRSALFYNALLYECVISISISTMIGLRVLIKPTQCITHRHTHFLTHSLADKHTDALTDAYTHSLAAFCTTLLTIVAENYSTKDPDLPNPPVSIIIADDSAGDQKKTSHVATLVSQNSTAGAH